MRRIEATAGVHTRRMGRKKLALGVVGLIVLVPVAAVAARGLQFRLDRIRIIYEGRVAVAPIASVLPGAEEVAYTATDGQRLKAWFLPAPSAASVAVLFHGTGASRATMAPLAKRLRAAGISVFLAEYRGAADSDGAPSETGLARDADAALSEAEALTGLGNDRVVAVGHSLGTAVAVGLANRHPLKGVVLIAPFTNLLDVTAVETNRLFAWLAAGPDRFDIVGTIAGIHAPLVIVRTEGDRIVPNAQSDRVMATAAQPKRVVTVAEGYPHADPRFVGGPEAAAAVVSLAET